MISLFLRVFFIVVGLAGGLTRPPPARAEEKAPGDDNIKNSRFFPSWHEEQKNSEQQFENELKGTLEMLPNVVTAKVHASFSHAGIWRDGKHRSSASVVILSEHPSLIQSDKLKNLVAGASSRLSESDVGIFVYHVKSLQPVYQKNVELVSRQKQVVEEWKKYVVAFILVLMCGALLLMFIGTRRLLRRRGWHLARARINGVKDQSASSSSGSVK